jgi:hypothetical protein
MKIMGIAAMIEAIRRMRALFYLRTAVISTS